jgi:hypothetical protein
MKFTDKTGRKDSYAGRRLKGSGGQTTIIIASNDSRSQVIFVMEDLHFRPIRWYDGRVFGSTPIKLHVVSVEIR